MDAGLAAAARALAGGDVLVALKWVSVRSDPPALAMRGIAMARLGELDVARDLLRRAARAFAKSGEKQSRARCLVAIAEIGLADRTFDHAREFEEAIRILDRADAYNAVWARLVAARRAVALGDLERAIALLDAASSDRPLAVAVRALAQCEVALRRLDADAARDALARARAAARDDVLAREVAALERAMALPVARVVRRGRATEARLDEIQALDPSKVVDLCRRHAFGRDFRRRPIPLAILRVLAEAWPDEASRETLVHQVFGVTRANESHRARLRVEIGRARTIAHVAIEATPRGFRLVAQGACVLAPPDPTAAGDVLAMLAQGGAWPASSLAKALGKSVRTVQRALGELESRAEIVAIGKGRARRWARRSGIASHLLLPGLLAAGP